MGRSIDGSTSVHDNILVSYEVGCKSRKIILHTEYPFEPREWMDVVFSGVECYDFQNDGTAGTIIFGVEQVDPIRIYEDNQGRLVKGIPYAWTGDWAKTRESALEYFEKQDIQGYWLTCSLGMHGWILARSMRIERKVQPQQQAAAQTISTPPPSA